MNIFRFELAQVVNGAPQGGEMTNFKVSMSRSQNAKVTFGSLEEALFVTRLVLGF